MLKIEKALALVLPLAATLPFVGGSTAPPDARVAPFAVQDDDEEHEHTPLEENMEEIEDALKRLRRSLREEDGRDASLEHLATMQAATVAAKGFVPEMAATVPDAERAAFTTAYRRMMVELLRHQLDLEAALLDGDEDAISEAFSKVREMEDKGHEKFTEDE